MTDDPAEPDAKMACWDIGHILWGVRKENCAWRCRDEDDNQMFFLNRKVRCKLDDAAGWKLELEANARHLEIVMRHFGFNQKIKGADIPES